MMISSPSHLLHSHRRCIPFVHRIVVYLQVPSAIERDQLVGLVQSSRKKTFQWCRPKDSLSDGDLHARGWAKIFGWTFNA